MLRGGVQGKSYKQGNWPPFLCHCPVLAFVSTPWHWRVPSRPAGIRVCLNDICGGYGRGWHRGCPWLCLGVWMGSVTHRPVSCRSRRIQSLAGTRVPHPPWPGWEDRIRFLSMTPAAVMLMHVPSWVSSQQGDHPLGIRKERRGGLDRKTRAMLAETGILPTLEGCRAHPEGSSLGRRKMLLAGWCALLSR